MRNKQPERKYKKYLVDYYEKCVRDNPIGEYYFHMLDENIAEELSQQILEEEKVSVEVPWSIFTEDLVKFAQMNRQSRLDMSPYQKGSKFPFYSVEKIVSLRHSHFIKEGLKHKIFQIGNVSYTKDIMGVTFTRKISPKGNKSFVDHIKLQIASYGLGTTDLYDEWVTLIKKDEEEDLEYL